jgi:uncharacterized protein (TIGR00369 family)
MSQTSVEQLMAAMPYAAHLGITLDSATPDEVVGHLDWTADLCTAAGLLHGGALMSLADTVGAVCAFLCIPEGANTATTSSTTHLVRGVRDGSVTATASPLHRGRRNIVVQTDLTDGRGRLVAQTTQTQAVLT